MRVANSVEHVRYAQSVFIEAISFMRFLSPFRFVHFPIFLRAVNKASDPSARVVMLSC